jgi:hypothetical protein
MKRLFGIIAVLSLSIGAWLVLPPATQAKPLAPIADTAPTLGSGLPLVTTSSNLIEARYWRYRHRHWRRHYHWRRWHYRHWHRRY